MKAKRFFETLATVFIPRTIARGDLRSTARLLCEPRRITLSELLVSEPEGAMILRKVDDILPVDTAQNPRKLECS